MVLFSKVRQKAAAISVGNEADSGMSGAVIAGYDELFFIKKHPSLP
jgi:hypothetical protein